MQYKKVLENRIIILYHLFCFPLPRNSEAFTGQIFFKHTWYFLFRYEGICFHTIFLLIKLNISEAVIQSRR